MALPEMVFHLVAVSGLAECSACRTLVSWKLPVREFERRDDVPCPCCKATCEMDLRTLWGEVRIGRGRTVKERTNRRRI